MESTCPASAGRICAGAFCFQTAVQIGGVQARAVCGWCLEFANILLMNNSSYSKLVYSLQKITLQPACRLQHAGLHQPPLHPPASSTSHTPPTRTHPHTTHRTRNRTHSPPAYPTAADRSETLPRKSPRTHAQRHGSEIGPTAAHFFPTNLIFNRARKALKGSLKSLYIDRVSIILPLLPHSYSVHPTIISLIILS